MLSMESLIGGANVNSSTILLLTESLLAMCTLNVESLLSLNSRLSSGIITALGLDHGKLTNLTFEECFAFNVSLRMFTRSIVIQRHVEDLQLGVKSYQKKLNLTRPDTIIAVTELQIVEWHNYKHLDWITMRRDDDKLYKFKEVDFKRLHIQDIEDMLLLLNVHEKHRRPTACGRSQLGVESYQKKLKLTKPDTYHFDLKRKEAYTDYSNPRGFIYQNKDKQNRLMWIDELPKFSDGTLNDVRTALDDRLKGVRMNYLSQAIWRKSDKERAAPMIQAIDKQLKTRRIMRSLEKFVGGRLYEGDFMMLQRTI
nr:hypothetical protein [Tanacetum cinerariifolium]